MTFQTSPAVTSTSPEATNTPYRLATDEGRRELGLAYLYISHDIAVVERISHRVAVMYLGEIVEIGPRQLIFENPSHPYTRKLMAAVPIPDPRHRRRTSSLASDEVPGPTRPPDYEPRPRPFIEVSPGHYVQEFDENWDKAEV